jgi:hypothetical protein
LLRDLHDSLNHKGQYAAGQPVGLEPSLL